MKRLEASVRDQVALFVEGYLSAERFNDLLPNTELLDEADDPAATTVVMRAIGYLAEYQAGVRLEDEVRRALADDASWSIERSTFSGVTLQAGLEAQVRADVGTPLQVVYA